MSDRPTPTTMDGWFSFVGGIGPDPVWLTTAEFHALSACAWRPNVRDTPDWALPPSPTRNRLFDHPILIVDQFDALAAPAPRAPL